MKRDYRKEVDSGYDEKRLVESNIVALLRKNIPIDIITKSPAFNFKHIEMVRNLERGYIDKEFEILEEFGGYDKELSEQIVPDRYSGVSHPVGGELYPMDDKEEYEKFKLRDEYVARIETLKKLEIEKLSLEKLKLEELLTDFINKNSEILDKILDVFFVIHDLKLKNGVNIDELEYEKVYKEYGLDINKREEYEALRKEYKRLNDNFSLIKNKLIDALLGKIDTEKFNELELKKNNLEAEIVKRNTKLVNAFIRRHYGNLLVETDDLFQVCYIAMWEATKNFDYKLGGKFSTLAYKYMDSAVKHNFKQLTRYSWANYWGKEKIEILLKNTSRVLGREVTIEDLVAYGFLDISETTAKGYMDMAEEYSMSVLYPSSTEKLEDYELEKQYNTYFGDDEILDYDDGAPERIVVNEDASAYKTLLRDALKKALSTLTPQEEEVIVLRFGLNDEEPLSLTEVGERFNLSRERIRQIEAKALRKLRHPLRSRELKDFVGYDFIPYETVKLKH